MVMWGGVVACALAQTGCFAVAIATTRKEQLSTEVIATRVSSQRADVAGTMCYVDQRSAITTRTHVSSTYRMLAAAELVLGGLVSLLGAPAYYGGLPVAADGLVTAIYILAQDSRLSTTRTWDVSNETAACASRP